MKIIKYFSSHPSFSFLSSLPFVPLLGLLFLGFIGGLLLEASTVLLRLWCRDEGLSMTAMDILPLILFLGNLKIFWSPFLQHNIFSSYSHEKSLFLLKKLASWSPWRLWLSLLFLSTSFVLWFMTFLSPLGGWFLLLLSFLVVLRSSIDMIAMGAQMQAVSQGYWGFSESFCVNGYHLGMSLVGFLALRANAGGYSWPYLYGVMAFFVFLFFCLVTFGRSFFPFWSFLDHDCQKPSAQLNSLEKVSFFQTYRSSLFSWFSLKKVGFAFFLMIFYRCQDGFLMPQMNHFFLNHGFTKEDHAWIIGLGLWFSVIGGFLGGFLIKQWGYKKTLWFSWISHGSSWLCLWLFFQGAVFFTPEGTLEKASFWISLWPGAYFLQYFTSGLSLVPFYSLQLLCVEKEKSMTQLSLVTSINYFGFYISGLRSGWVVDTYGWSTFFGLSFLFLPMVAFFLHKTMTFFLKNNK